MLYKDISCSLDLSGGKIFGTAISNNNPNLWKVLE